MHARADLVGRSCQARVWCAAGFDEMDTTIMPEIWSMDGHRSLQPAELDMVKHD